MAIAPYIGYLMYLAPIVPDGNGWNEEKSTRYLLRSTLLCSGAMAIAPYIGYPMCKTINWKYHTAIETRYPTNTVHAYFMCEAKV